MPTPCVKVRQSASKCDIDARFRRRYHFSGRRAVGDEMPYTSGRGLMRSVARIGLPLVALSALTVSITLSTNGSSRDTGVQLETGSSPSAHAGAAEQVVVRSEAHTSELQSLMRISYAVFCLNKTTTTTRKAQDIHTK